MRTKRTWCDYDVQRSEKRDGKLFIRGNGSWQGSGVAHIYQENGITFSKGMEEKILWLVREGIIIPLAKQGKDGIIIILSDLITRINSGNVQILETDDWLEAEDGFVTTSPGQSFAFEAMETSQRHNDYAPVIMMTY